MLSRSAVVKLKAILIIDLIIVGAAAGVYFYLQDQGLLQAQPNQPHFTLNDLIHQSPSKPTWAKQFKFQLT